MTRKLLIPLLSATVLSLVACLGGEVSADGVQATAHTITGRLAPNAYLVNNPVVVARATDGRVFSAAVQSDLSFSVTVATDATIELSLANHTASEKLRVISQILLPTSDGPSQWASFRQGGETSLGTVRPNRGGAASGGTCFPSQTWGGCMMDGGQPARSGGGLNGFLDAGFGGLGLGGSGNGGFGRDGGLIGGLIGGLGLGGFDGGSFNGGGTGSGGLGGFSFDGGALFGSGVSFDGGFAFASIGTGLAFEDGGFIACPAADETTSQGSVSTDSSAGSFSAAAYAGLNQSWAVLCCDGITAEAGASPSGAFAALEIDNSDSMNPVCGCAGSTDGGGGFTAIASAGPGGAFASVSGTGFGGIGNAGPCAPQNIQPPTCGGNGQGSAPASDAGGNTVGGTCSTNSDCGPGLMCVSSTCLQNLQ